VGKGVILWLFNPYIDDKDGDLFILIHLFQKNGGVFQS
jgi:hypothetical protein